MTKNIEFYVDLPYTKIVRKDLHDDVFVAHVEELPGCSAHGNSEADALKNLRKSMQVWIKDSINAGDSIPDPAKEVELPSGKWVQRVPRSLHLKLIRIAKSEGVSLNQLVTSALAEAAGKKIATEYALQLQERANAPFTKQVLGSISQAVNKYFVWTNDLPETDSLVLQILVDKLAGHAVGPGPRQSSYIFEREPHGKSKKLALTAGD